MQNLAVGVVAGLLGVATLVAAPSLMGRNARAGLLEVQSAAFFPQWIAAALGLAGLVLIVLRPAPGAEVDPDAAAPDAPLRLAAVVAVLVALPFAFRLVGMAPALGLAILCLGLLFGGRNRVGLFLAAVLLPAAIDLALRRLLYVFMPEPVLW